MGVGYAAGAWDRSQLPPNVRVGSGCFLEREGSFELYRSTRPVGLRLGDGVQVFTWTTFNVEPEGTIEVGAGSVLVGAVFMCADEIVVGKDVMVSYNVTIADSDFHPRDPDLRRDDARANAPFGDRSRRPPLGTAPVHIGDGAAVGIGAIILKGVRIGRGAHIAPGSVVTADVAAGALVAGNPARPVPRSGDGA